MARKPLGVGELGTISTKKVSDRPVKWRARVRVGCVDGVTRYAQADAATQATAKEKVKAAARRKAYGAKQTQLTAQTLSTASTVFDVVKAWVDGREVISELGGNVVQQKGQVRAQTVEKYRELYPTLRGERGEWNLATMTIDNVTTDNVSTWLETVSHRAPTTAKMSKIMLSGAFTAIMRKGIVDWRENPTAGANLYKGVKHAPEALSAHDEARAIKLAEQWQTDRKSVDLVGVVKFLAGTGMRPSEALALRWEDVDLTTTPATVKVTGIVVEAKGRGLFRQPVTKTINGLRVNQLPKATTDMLMERWMMRDSDLVFPNRVGGLMSLRNLNRAWREARGKELKHVRLKDFRPTVATKIERAFGVEAAARHLGHGSTKVTLDHYVEAEAAGDYTAAIENGL